MKKIHIFIGAIGFAMTAQGCVQTVSSSTGSCPPTTGGALQEIASSCFSTTVTASNDFSINLDSVRVFSGQTLEIIAKASAVAENDGWKIAFTGGTSGKVRVSKLGSGEAMDSIALDTTDGKEWCFDIHGNGAEDPHHIIFWRGNCPTVQLAAYGNAAFNSNNESAVANTHSARSSSNYGTGMATCGLPSTGTCFAAGSNPTGIKVLYKADVGTTTSITVKAARTSAI